MGTISVAVPYDDRWFFSEVIRGARERAAHAGHTASVHVIPPDSGIRAADAIEGDLSGGDALGAVIAGFKPAPDSAARAAAYPRPIVVVGGSVVGLPTVMIDDLGAARDAMEHLRSLGHRRITHFAGVGESEGNFNMHNRRARGYRQAMEAAGLPLDIVEIEFDDDDVRAKARAVLARENPPTAIFAMFDEVAFPILEAVREAGLRPGHEVSVMGIDDHPRSEEEGLSTIRQRPAELGATAVDMVLEGVEQGASEKQSRLGSLTLVQRASTGPHRTF